ncbi:MAG: tetratricopeptide repeat protein [Acidobacteriota bacterium]
MAELTGDARIRDLKRRLELDPSSRLFVTLAEEYRKSGLLAEALSALQKGLLAHPNYLSAQVALGRAYLEAGQITESIVTFNRVLASDPGNLVSAKSLADIYMSRGEGVEAIKKYKLYRALSGDRTVDEIIERLQAELAPPPPPVRVTEPLPPPPTFFEPKPIGPIRTSRELRFDAQPRTRASEIGESSSSIKPLSFELDDSSARRPAREPEPYVGVLSRDNTPDHPQTSVLQPATAPPPPSAIAAVPSPWMSPAATPPPEPAPEPAFSEDSSAGSFASPWSNADAEPSETTDVPRESREPATEAPPEPWTSREQEQAGFGPAAQPFTPSVPPAAFGGEFHSLAGPSSVEARHPDEVTTHSFRIADVLSAAAAGNGQPDGMESTGGVDGADGAGGAEGNLPRAEDSDSVSDSEGDGNGDLAGRTLADLYFAQGHYAEALDIYDELASANPFDAELKRLRRDAEARLLPAAGAAVPADVERTLNRRLARVRALKQWLSVVQAG